jgi:hypothetical protein
MTQTSVRSYLKLVPAEFFGIACCDGNVNKYAKKYVTVEDNANGFMKSEYPKYAGFVLKVFPSKPKPLSDYIHIASIRKIIIFSN